MAACSRPEADTPNVLYCRPASHEKRYVFVFAESLDADANVRTFPHLPVCVVAVEVHLMFLEHQPGRISLAKHLLLEYASLVGVPHFSENHVLGEADSSGLVFKEHKMDFDSN